MVKDRVDRRILERAKFATSMGYEYGTNMVTDLMVPTISLSPYRSLTHPLRRKLVRDLMCLGAAHHTNQE